MGAVQREAKPFSPFSQLLMVLVFAPPAMLNCDSSVQCLWFKSHEVKIRQSDSGKSEHDCEASKDGEKNAELKVTPFKTAMYPSIISCKKFLRNYKQANELKTEMHLRTSYFFVIFPNQQWTDVTNEKLGL